MTTTTQAKPATINWPGKSGKKYTYSVYKLPTNFTPNQDGNYIYTKLVDGHWIPIYIGQGDLSIRISGDHHKADCIERKGATHVHAHLNNLKADRLAEESDLLENFPQARQPKGCNG